MFPKWNPQPEFISGEENSEFQDFLVDGTRLFILLFLTSRNPDFDLGVGFADTEKGRQNVKILPSFS